MEQDGKSKNLLEEKIEKSIKTTMIGSLFIMEEHFDELLDEPDLAAIFSKVRSDILRLGNNNIRGIKKELQDYDVTYKKNTYTFKVSRNLSLNTTQVGNEEGKEDEYK